MEYTSIIIIVIFTIFRVNISTLQSNQKRIESKLDRIIEYLELPEPSRENLNDELKDELIGLVKDNKKVLAFR